MFRRRFKSGHHNPNNNRRRRRPDEDEDMSIATSTAAQVGRHQPQEPKRDPIGFLLLHRIEYTDANPWLAVVGLIFAAALGGFLNLVLS
jgi:hypothetical protein